MPILWRAVLFLCVCYAVNARYHNRGGPFGPYGPWDPYGHDGGHRNRPPPGFPYVPQVKEADSTLILTHVVFRHGNRTAEPSELYPNDPYLNYTYYPIGRGQLTNVGKIKEYMIGQDLRARYNRFLGDYYYPEQVDAVSTDKNRTKASLELVLASLFAPRRDQIWNFALNWQPVPYNFHPTDQDPVLYGINCPNYVKNYEDLVNSRKYLGVWDENRETFNYISRYSGLNVTMYRDVYDMYFGLSTEEEFGLQLPAWTKRVWPKIVTDMSVKEYYVETGTTKLASIASGFHIKKIIEDSKRKIQNLEEGPKIYLYSAHENNVAEIQVTLNVFDNPHVPTYGSYFIVEVHNINGVVGIKLYYKNWTKEGLKNLSIPNCGTFCPLDTFEKLYADVLPASEDVCYQID